MQKNIYSPSNSRYSHEWEEQILVGFRHGYVRIDLPAPLARQRAGKVTIKKDLICAQSYVDYMTRNYPDQYH